MQGLLFPIIMLTTNGVGCDVLCEKEIVRLLNLVNNPSYTHLEDSDFEASVPTLKEGPVKLVTEMLGAPQRETVKEDIYAWKTNNI
ncbi:MAG: hypothetical protein RR869_06345 [Lachnospiraceae bacterium]